MTVVPAFPLPPEGWADLAGSYCPPEIPATPFTCLGFPYNDRDDLSLSDTEYKAKAREHFDRAVSSYRALLSGIEQGVDAEQLQSVQDNLADSLAAANCLSRLQVVDQVVGQLKSQFN